MGAGQIGGIATLLDIDFNNAAGFLGKPAYALEGQHVVYYLSHAMLFCAGALIEPHVVLTPAVCVYSEDYKFSVYGGTHRFLQNTGVSRFVENVCIHRAYNHTDRCSTDNIALLVINPQYDFREREPNTEYILNRVRYGIGGDAILQKKINTKCRYYGWGSRRNGFLLPLLINLRRMDVRVLESKKCDETWNTDNKFLCLETPPCTNDKYGTLCPDDLGSVLICEGYAQGMMTSLLMDRPCGVGFLNLALYSKFIDCAVDDSRDAIADDSGYYQKLPLPEVKKINIDNDIEDTSPTTCVDPFCAPKVTLPKPATVGKLELIREIEKAQYLRTRKQSKHH